MSQSTDYKALCAQLLDVIDSLPCETNYKNESRCVFPIDEDVVSRARLAVNHPEPERLADEELDNIYWDESWRAGADDPSAINEVGLSEFRLIARAVLARWGRPIQPEPQGSATLNWSEERQPCEECRYNHCIAETPFGRFLISWKEWKDYLAVTADETPFGDWFDCWGSVEAAKAACQAEYNRRLSAVISTALAQLGPEGPADAELMALMPQQLRNDLSTVSRLAAYGTDVHHGLYRVTLNTGILNHCRAVLARFARPAIEPVPVSERLPGPEDYLGRPWEGIDAGFCWWFYPSLDGWRLMVATRWEDGAYQNWIPPGATHWLPHHVLPVPTTHR